MRKSPGLTAIAIVSILSLPAHAAKFNCTFYSSGSPVGQPCGVDSSNSSAQCMHQYSGTLFGTCVGGGNQIGCIFTSERIAADANLTAPDAQTLRAGPGLLSGAIVEASTKRLLAGYKENRSAAEADAVCMPSN
jgi:hypothetical protein